MNTISIGIIILCIVLIAVIKYREIQYNYKAATAVLLRNLLVEKYGFKHDFAERICMELYGIKEGDFFRTEEAAIRGAEHLEGVFNEESLQNATIKECEALRADHFNPDEFQRIREQVVSRYLKQLAGKTK